ncbi:MAG: hypothetical protein PVJ04_07425 [Gemmatimonadota bacterium]|jgi:hypothetical protein
MLSKRSLFSPLTILPAALLLAAPVQGQMASSGLQEVVIRTRDYQFEAPAVVRSGPTHIELINEGPDFHHVWLVRLLDGKTVEDLKAFLAGGDAALPDWAVDEGGPNTPDRPGEETSVYMDLKPGNYAMMCVIPAAVDGLPHIAHGMIQGLEVVESASPDDPAAFPKPDMTMTLDDYSFGLSKLITPGEHTIRVVNDANQAHEVVVVKLAEGKTAQDFVQWVGTVPREKGNEPGEILGGVTGISKGEFNIFTMDFEPGRYALLCFVPDAGDGMPHFMHGMVQEFTVG